VSLQETNPELVIHTWSERSNASTRMNQREGSPFTDIRVRRAMQMAMDLESMNDTYFRGYADTIPRGLVGREFQDYMTPFEEWPEELKQYYRYDPEMAEKLLDEAGYPRGADGTRLSAIYIHFPRFDVSWPELKAAYWRDVGVEVIIETPTDAEYSARGTSGDFHLSLTVAGVKADPLWQMSAYRGGIGGNRAGVDDAQFNEWYDAAFASNSLDEAYELVKKMDYRIVEQHWQLWGPLAPAFTVHQPWVIGYNAEGGFGGMQNMVVFSRLWIDQELKTEMGR
jgi:ABC-type transport system substrate-binding protein